MIPFHIIVAMDSQQGIGKDGRLPWYLPADLRHFKEITCRTQQPNQQNVVIMGRKTWDSLPEKFRPLPQRINVVVSHNKNLKLPKGVLWGGSLEEALQLLDKKEIKEKIDSVFVIGGEQIFQLALTHPSCQKLFVTHIKNKFDCDTFFPPFQNQFKLFSAAPEQSDSHLKFYFAQYQQ